MNDRHRKIVPSRWEPKRLGTRNKNGNHTNIPRASSRLAAEVPFKNLEAENKSLEGKISYDGSAYGILAFKKPSESNNETVQK